MKNEGQKDWPGPYETWKKYDSYEDWLIGKTSNGPEPEHSNRELIILVCVIMLIITIGVVGTALGY